MGLFGLFNRKEKFVRAQVNSDTKIRNPKELLKKIVQFAKEQGIDESDLEIETKNEPVDSMGTRVLVSVQYEQDEDGSTIRPKALEFTIQFNGDTQSLHVKGDYKKGVFDGRGSDLKQTKIVRQRLDSLLQVKNSEYGFSYSLG